MKRLDLDDLPPKIGALLTGLDAGEELVLVQDGVVVGRLTGGEAPAAAASDPPDEPEAHMKEVFDHFRAAVEDEF